MGYKGAKENCPASSPKTDERDRNQQIMVHDEIITLGTRECYCKRGRVMIGKEPCGRGYGYRAPVLITVNCATRQVHT